jgi:hypothetical protein
LITEVFNGVTLYGTPNIAGWKLPNLQQPKRTLLVMEWVAHAPLSWHRSKTGKANAPLPDAESVVAFADGHVNLTKIYYDGYNAAYTRDPIPGYEYQHVDVKPFGTDQSQPHAGLFVAGFSARATTLIGP